MTTSTDNWADTIGQSAIAAIREMVAALQVDWERLEELRGEFDAVNGGDPEEVRTWDEENGKEYAELLAAAGDCEDEDDARQRIEEDPLSIELGGWWLLGSEPEPTEYRILLTTGGPAVRIIGDLDQNNEPSRARLEVQDWGKPWTEYFSGDNDHYDILLAYVACFYLGD